jgi:Zn-dependent peptidase ImmA (M78 family)/transcriptional regulator with XRE-family HTH domain
MTRRQSERMLRRGRVLLCVRLHSPLSADQKIAAGPPSFEPSRLRLARELNGLSQLKLAGQLGLTAPALSQFESGATRPAHGTLQRLAEQLGVPLGFFTLPSAEVHEGFFRSLRRTAVSERRRARAIAHIARDVAVSPAVRHGIPECSLLRLPITLTGDRVEVEHIATETRRFLALPDGPAPSIVQLLEAHGIVVIRLSLNSADVDAFSLPFTDRPVVVLSANKNDRARSRFDASHELGHLVMHADLVWGLSSVEQQAHEFAAAFLMPEKDIRSELPKRVDWPLLFELKRKWQVSLAALLMRAKTLGVMSEANYVAALKAAAMRGWRRVEPVPLGIPEEPRLLTQLVAKLDVFKSDATLPATVIRELVSAGSQL